MISRYPSVEALKIGKGRAASPAFFCRPQASARLHRSAKPPMGGNGSREPLA
jgi:hypothetical protein